MGFRVDNPLATNLAAGSVKKPQTMRYGSASGMLRWAMARHTQMEADPNLMACHSLLLQGRGDVAPKTPGKCGQGAKTGSKAFTALMKAK